MTTLSQISIPCTTATLAAARANADIQIALRPACKAARDTLDRILDARDAS